MSRGRHLRVMPSPPPTPWAGAVMIPTSQLGKPRVGRVTSSRGALSSRGTGQDGGPAPSDPVLRQSQHPRACVPQLPGLPQASPRGKAAVPELAGARTGTCIPESPAKMGFLYL